MKKLWIWAASLALLASCGKEIPKDILPPEQMESVLYDYHLALGLSGNDFNQEYQKEAFRQFVFDKHDISEAVFDSSMVWYTRHSSELATIYENLSKRFEKEHERIDILVEGQKEDALFASGDTVDLWRKKKIHWLAETPLKNQLLININSDTTFHARDTFLWELDCHFLSPGKAVMGLNVIYENDSVVGRTETISQSGHYAIRLHNDSTVLIRNLNGFIQLMSDSASQNPNLLVHGISLTRYHAKIENDSLATAKVPTPKQEDLKDEKLPQ